MIKLKGFTMAEVLITLAIVGVVATLTMPALMANVSKQSAGPALAKAVNSLENANKMIFADNMARQLQTVCGDDYLACIQDYLEGSFITSIPKYEETYSPTVKDSSTAALFSLAAFAADETPTDSSADSTSGTASAFPGSKGFVTKDGIVFYQNAGPTAMSGAPDKYYGKYYTIYIDVDGPKKGMNRVGRDTFLVYVDLNGTVIPYGGQLYKEYSDGESVLWESGCLKPTPSNSKTCSGSIADNGWKVVY